MIASLSYAVSGFVTAASLVNRCRGRKYLQQIEEVRREARWLQSPDRPFMFILLPVLNESTTVASLIDNIGALKYPRDRLVVLVLTAPEVDEAKSTRRVAQQILDHKQYDWMRVVHLEHESSRKADQLNRGLEFAEQHCTASGWDLKQVVIGVFDADSRPELELLDEVGYRFSADPELDALQAYPVYTDELAQRSAWMQIEAERQTARALCVEGPRNLRYQLSSKGLSRLLAVPYLIGHGQFFRAPLLFRARFPVKPPIDDLVQGLAYSLAGRKIGVASHVDHCTVPHSVSVFIPQTRTWFTAQCSLLAIIDQYRIVAQRRGLGAAWIGILRLTVFDTIPWAFRFFELPISIWESCRRRDPRHLLAVLLALAIESQLERSIVTHASKTFSIKQPDRMLLRSLLRPTIKSIGPISAVVLRSLGCSIKHQKTPRT
ncbi:glycosyltransferase [Streptomyces violascens]|uniref:glycosyltransferase n=1 Tax=Streptomyces violascens TaxID=67381 RepID=UPI00368301AB